MVVKSKVFRGSDNTLENLMNEWYLEHPDCKIIHSNLEVLPKTDMSPKSNVIDYIVLLIYSE